MGRLKLTMNLKIFLKLVSLMSSCPDDAVEVVKKDKKRCMSDERTLAKSFGHARDLKRHCSDSVSPELSPADFRVARLRKRFRHSTGTPALVNDEMSSRCEKENHFQSLPDSKNDMEVDSSDSGNFASSSPSPTPDDGLLPDTAGIRESGGFYMLRKDSERKSTLVNLLSDDKEQICDKWHQAIFKEPNTLNHRLNKAHLLQLINGFQEYFKDFGTGTLRSIIDSFRDEVDYDPLAINELRLAIYFFPQTVGERLRMQRIPPHWMFALDNLLREAVQSAITVFSPELLPVMGSEGSASQKHNRTESFISDMPEEESTSAASTTDSRRSPNHLKMQELAVARARLEEDIRRMEMKHLESLKKYHDVLRAATEQLDCNTSFIRNLMALRHDPLSSAFNPPEPRLNPNGNMLPPPPSLDGSNEELGAWLKEIGLDQVSVNRIICEEFTKRQLLDVVTREDLRKLNLKGGMFCRLWEVIHKHRRT